MDQEPEYFYNVGPECPCCHTKADAFNGSKVCSICEMQAFTQTYQDGTYKSTMWKSLPQCEIEILWMDEQTILSGRQKQVLKGYLPPAKILSLRAFL